MSLKVSKKKRLSIIPRGPRAKRKLSGPTLTAIKTLRKEGDISNPKLTTNRIRSINRRLRGKIKTKAKRKEQSYTKEG